jgi:hypothetical protein
MLPLLIAMGAPLFAIAGYALFQPNPAAVEAVGKGLKQPLEYNPPPAF